MKRIACFLLAACMLLSLSACGKTDAQSDADPSIDVEYYAKLGKMPECDYTLGADVDRLTEALSAAAEPDADGDEDEAHEDEPVFDVTELDDRVRISSGTFEYYYRPDRKDDGVAYIVNYETAYGFAVGTVIIEIQNRLSAFTAVEDDAKPFFLPAGSSFSTLTYTFGDNAVVFVFQNNALCATAVYSPALWNE